METTFLYHWLSVWMFFQYNVLGICLFQQIFFCIVYIDAGLQQLILVNMENNFSTIKALKHGKQSESGWSVMNPTLEFLN